MNKEIKETLRVNKMRMTPLVKKIIPVFLAAKKPLSVEELLFLINPLRPNKTTLYRQMQKMREVGLLQETIFSDAVRRYCLVRKDHHHHFICQRCGAAEDLPKGACESVMNPLTEKLKKRGLKILKHALEVEGLCVKCA